MLGTPRKQVDAKLLLQAAEAVEGSVGLDYLRKLVEALRDHMAANVAFITVAEDKPATRARMICALQDGLPRKEVSYRLADTPCARTYDGETVVIPCDLVEQFPDKPDRESYVGLPLRIEADGVDGHLAVFSGEPIKDTEIVLSIVRIFGQRIEAEQRRALYDRRREEFLAKLERANDRLQRRYHALHDANEFKTRLVGMIAHDLRSPLSAMVAQAELIETLLAADPDSRVARACAKVLANADRMAGMISATLERVRSESCGLTIQKAPVDLAELARSAAAANERAAAVKRASICLEAPEQVVAPADEELLLEAVDNLISNAIKYGFEDGAVTVSVFSDGEMARIQVSDDGQGLTEEDLSRVFGRFATLSAKPTGDETATGLGLANVKEVAEAHGGWARAESAGRNMGATFEIALPFAAEL